MRICFYLKCADCGGFLDNTLSVKSDDGHGDSHEIAIKPCADCTAKLRKPIEALREALTPPKKKS